MTKDKIDKYEKLIKKYGVKRLNKVDKKDHFLKIETYKVDLNNGHSIYRDKLIKNSKNGNGCATVMIPLINNKQVLMVVQPRVFSKYGALIEFPAGYVDNGENHLDACKRELLEETGYKANKITKLVGYYQDEGIGDAYNEIFIVEDLIKISDLHLDKDEYLEPVVVDIDDIEELNKLGFIASGGSRIGYLELLRYLGGK